MTLRTILSVIVVIGLVGVLAAMMAPRYMPAATSTPVGGGDAHGNKEKEGAHEEGVELSDAKVAASGIELVEAGPTTLRDSLRLNGIVQPNQETLVQVTPRFPGVVREVQKRIGDRVRAGELLAKVESNQSLTTYEMRAPIAGTIIDRQASLGEYVSEQKPTFVIADLSTVWIDFSVYRRDTGRVRLGDTVLIDVDDGGAPLETKVSYISPVGNSDTQSALARGVVANSDLRLKPGFFVAGRLILSAKQVAVAVKNAALQTIENRTVVFVRNGTKFEARDVELGERDAEHVEVRFGLMEGDVYAGKNSFVIKAEIAKGTASHEH